MFLFLFLAILPAPFIIKTRPVVGYGTRGYCFRIWSLYPAATDDILGILNTTKND